jgi:hypothetical protein
MNRSKSPLSSYIVAIVVAGCGGGSPAQDASDVESASSEGEGADAPTESEAEIAWADMNRDQRMEYMGLTVLPGMKALFEQYDPKGFAEFKCQTCHGDDMQAVDYAMPNGLFALSKPDPIPDSMDYDADMTKFMLEKVKPEMAKMLGQESNPEFGCFNCHDAEE